MEMLSKVRQEGCDSWARGDFSSDSLERTAILNLQAVELMKVYTGLIDMSYEDYEGVMEDE